jgi:Family of unknown function (DUF5627)/Domain of unknown function (DUF1735)
MKKVLGISMLVIVVLAACNKKNEFPDYKYSSVYFPYQAPVRTLVLGEDIYDNTSDNAHKFTIMATMGGVYENNKDVVLTATVDNSLAQRVRFNSGAGDSVIAMPDSYYTLPSKTANITIPSGSIMGGVEIQLTDAFFADPRSIKKTFVIPMRITAVTNADSILKGKSNVATPDPLVATDWSVIPKDYVLYAVKYINPYHGTYLRRGVDVVKGSNGNTALDTTVAYHAAFVEKDELANISTKSLTADSILLTAKNKGGLTKPFTFTMSFDNAGMITVSGPAGATYTVAGTGDFVKKGDSWGNQQRDVVHLKYAVDFGTSVHNFTDTLVLRDRGVAFETFVPVRQ